MPNVNADFTVLQTVVQFFNYALLAVFAENVVLSRAMGVSRLIKLVGDPDVKTWQYCLPVILVQLFSSPLGWAAHNLLTPILRTVLPEWLPVAALRPLIYLTCTVIAMGIAALVLLPVPAGRRKPFLEQLPGATFNCCVLGTLMISANQNYTLLQSVGFGFGSGLGYLFAVLIVDEGRRRLRSKDVPAIFRGLPSFLIYMGILSLAIYGLMGRAGG